MKSIYYPLLIVFLFFSCKATKSIPYSPIQSIKVENDLNELYTHYTLQPIDSVAYLALLKRHQDEACAQLQAFAKTDMAMVRLTKKETDFQYHEYGSCRATQEGDSIRIRFDFGKVAGGTITYFAGKPLEIILRGQQYHPTITHTSDAMAMVKVNGKYQQVPFPTSTFTASKLSLNKSSYEVGDTIRGIFNGQAFLPQKDPSRNQKELIKGPFRVILEKAENRCR